MSNTPSRNEKIGFNLLTLLNLASAIPILVHNQSSKHIKSLYAFAYHSKLIVFREILASFHIPICRQTAKLHTSGYRLHLFLIFRHDTVFISRSKLAITTERPDHRSTGTTTDFTAFPRSAVIWCSSGLSSL